MFNKFHFGFLFLTNMTLLLFFHISKLNVIAKSIGIE